MRRTWLLGLVAVGFTGCAQPRLEQGSVFPAPASAKTGPASPAQPEPLATPSGSVTGRVVSVNLQGRFVVLSFPVGGVPPADRRLSTYRGGLKVADLKITRWHIDNNAVADILNGECRVGDEVRTE